MGLSPYKRGCRQLLHLLHVRTQEVSAMNQEEVPRRQPFWHFDLGLDHGLQSYEKKKKKNFCCFSATQSVAKLERPKAFPK